MRPEYETELPGELCRKLSHVWSVLPKVLHKGHLEEEVISEVKFAGQTIQGVKQRTN